MSRIVLFNLMTVDGFFAGLQGEIDWHNVDAEFNDFAIEQTRSADGLIFGRITYELMAAYWPTAEAERDDPVVAGLMNALPKVVFSRTLESVDWNNARLVRGEAAPEVARLRAQPGGDWFIFGSANLAAALTRAGLIDEYRVLVNPLLLGRGLPLFPDAGRPLRLTLVNTRAFKAGNVLLSYRPVKTETA